MIKSAGSLDTNILLRLLLNDVPKQHNAALELYNSCEGQFTVADTVIIEVVFVLCRAYDFTRQQGADAVNGLINLPKLNINTDLSEQSLTLFIKHPALSFEDCYLATYAKLNNAEPLWTFDKKLSKQVANTKLVELETIKYYV